MPKNPYIYSVQKLKDIVTCYDNIYQGIEFHRHKIYSYTETNPWEIAEYKADFDMALDSIGKGHWTGEIMEFKYYHNFGKLQRIIIAGIVGIGDWELEEMGFYQVGQLRGWAYKRMANYLNGIPIYSNLKQFQLPSQNKFVSKPL